MKLISSRKYPRKHYPSILHEQGVFENRELRRIFGPNRDEVTGRWRKLHNEELCDLYSSPSIDRMVKSRTIKLAEHVARMGRRGMRIVYW
jgi:hypothetical protein